ncbi:MAG: hypothetical protein GTO41_02010, partial [Burkholderiales bacterium]|nr:hypothetical protein [Burkholderiales bacterium]
MALVTSVPCYVIKGSGRSFQQDQVIESKASDAFLFPAGKATVDEAPDGEAVLFVGTNQPFLSMTHCALRSIEEAHVMSTRYVGETIAARREDVAQRAQPTPPPTQLFDERGRWAYSCGLRGDG